MERKLYNCVPMQMTYKHILVFTMQARITSITHTPTVIESTDITQRFDCSRVQSGEFGCYSCSLFQGCGWCFEDQLCTPGNDDGPFIVQCTERLDGSLPKWSTTSCEDVPNNIPSEGSTSIDEEEEESSATRWMQCWLLSAIVAVVFL
jgi:hypothetical protein